MLVFYKKRIIFLLVATLLPIGIFVMQTANNNMNSTISTMAVPVTSKTIIIDAGHRTEKMVGL